MDNENMKIKIDHELALAITVIAKDKAGKVTDSKRVSLSFITENLSETNIQIALESALFALKTQVIKEIIP